jgi:hypothetical protein
MSNLLKAMGFWMWGLIAIGISVSLVSVSYRMLAVYRSHDLAASFPSSAASPNAGVAVPPTRIGLKGTNVNVSREPVISRVIAKEISAAQKSMQSGQWSEALRNLEAAGLNAPLSAYDTKTIEDFRGISYIRLNNSRAAQKSYEAALSTGAYKEEELIKIFRLLFQLAAANQQPAKAIEYGEKAYDVGALKSNDFLIMSQLYYQQKDCKNSAVWGDKAIASYREEGVAPKEVLYQIKLQCASEVNDTGAMIAALSDLVRLTNKTSYWNNLIRLERQDERDDHNLLMIYRVMYDTNSMQADTDYIEMAQLLGDAALPGEAQLVLEKLMSSGVLKEDHKERTSRLLSAMKTRADADKQGLPALKPDEAYVYLGRQWITQNKPAEAKKTFAQLRTVPNISPRVLRLWNLYADTIPEARSASL